MFVTVVEMGIVWPLIQNLPMLHVNVMGRTLLLLIAENIVDTVIPLAEEVKNVYQQPPQIIPDVYPILNTLLFVLAMLH